MIRTGVAVVGGGPAGIAAATAATAHGEQVVVLDDNSAPGGQIWRDGFESGGGETRRERTSRNRVLQTLQRSGAQVLTGHRVFQVSLKPLRIAALQENAAVPGSVVSIQCNRLVIATGARERFLPFPGWTLPGVYGAGGLQALVRGGFPVRGRAVVIAGSGPLLLAVAAHLRAAGANIREVAEQTSFLRLSRFALSLVGRPGKLVQGAGYRFALRRSGYRPGWWPVAAITSPDQPGVLRAVRLSNGRHTREVPCDLLACGFHLVPNTEVAALFGCRLHDGFVSVDAYQRTSVQGVFCVGEPTGIAGLDAARLQGEIAGLMCAGARPSAALLRRSRSEKLFGRRLDRAFAPRPELRQMPLPDTIVCRCEDVPFASVRERSGWTDSKLQTRCGMGPCQGRICGPALQTLLGWQPTSVRPPLFPVPVEALCSDELIPQGEDVA